MRRATLPSNPLLAFALVVALTASLPACGDSGSGDSGSGDDGGGAEARQPAGGGRGSERQRISAVVRAMYDDFAAGDANGVCAAMSVDARESVALNVIGGSTEAPGHRTCAESFAKFVDAAAGSGVLESVEEIEVGDIAIDRELATVTVGIGDRSGKVQLIKEQGDWRFDAAPGSSGSPGVPVRPKD
jgi:ketosteroid isomerase-like protein